ncbi:MAG: hypothetical protein IEMM0002_1213 [bacterium]|nr:MAG: hypothetical protein IEMM0002_1213 [bacterium]
MVKILITGNEEPIEYIAIESGWSLQDAIAQFEAEYIAKCLVQHDQDITKAAASLQITVQNLNEKMSNYGLK